jgi:CheY-like chemotaxis protein
MKKILLVEDDEVERELVRMTLERAGYRVVAAEDGARGFELAEAERPDLIVTDVWMPAQGGVQAEGVQFVRRVRETPGLDATPILVVTGFGEGGATLSLVGGADAFEPKPLDPDALLAAVARLLA